MVQNLARRTRLVAVLQQGHASGGEFLREMEEVFCFRKETSVGDGVEAGEIHLEDTRRGRCLAEMDFTMV